MTEMTLMRIEEVILECQVLGWGVLVHTNYSSQESIVIAPGTVDYAEGGVTGETPDGHDVGAVSLDDIISVDQIEPL